MYTGMVFCYYLNVFWGLLVCFKVILLHMVGEAKNEMYERKN